MYMIKLQKLPKNYIGPWKLMFAVVDDPSYLPQLCGVKGVTIMEVYLTTDKLGAAFLMMFGDK